MKVAYLFCAVTMALAADAIAQPEAKDKKLRSRLAGTDTLSKGISKRASGVAGLGRNKEVCSSISINKNTW